MRKICLSVVLSALSAAAMAQSTVNIAGGIRLALVHGNGGSSPVDGLTARHWAVNDHTSYFDVNSREELGQGLYASAQLRAFTAYDSGRSTTPFWTGHALVKLGGAWGELYAGRAVAPASLMVLHADPWYWDNSAAQAGWMIQQAHYTSTGYVRTDNTLGYSSASWRGLTVNLAVSAGEGQKGRDVGFATEYKRGPLWLGLGYDRSPGLDGGGPMDHLWVLAGAYELGAWRPMFSIARSEVNGRPYRAFTLAATAPLGERWQLKAAFSRLNDWRTATPVHESLRKLAIGGQYNFSKRSALFLTLSEARGDGASATRHSELGMAHSF